MKPWASYEIEPVRWWFVMRCWLLHFWRHTFEWDEKDGEAWVGVRYCPKCHLVVRVVSSDEGVDR